MKPASVILLAFTGILLFSACDKDTLETPSSDPENLEGTWFRSHPIKVWGGHNQPSFERGEAHIRLSFQDNGEFIHNRTVLGLYEDQSPEDTTGVTIEFGTYTAGEREIDIDLNRRIWWDSFYDDMANYEDFAESGVNPDKYLDVTYEIIEGTLHLVYYTRTDLITPEQGTPGLDKFEEAYTKE